MNRSLRRLREQLCRELTQAEYDAIRHCTREAKRLEPSPPASCFRAIAIHAAHLQPRWEAIVMPKQSGGVRLARLVGEAFSNIRHYALDRVLSAERSYRATLLGLWHGYEAARLLREVASCEHATPLVEFSDRLLEERRPLLQEAERALGWFARNPALALASGSARGGSRDALLHPHGHRI